MNSQVSPGNQGNNLPGLPENQLFAELRYQHGSGFYLVADALNIGKLYANNANTVTAGSSIVANIRAGFELKRGQWQVAPFLGVNNIFDESYNTNLRINGFGGRLFEPAPGINLLCGFHAEYDTIVAMIPDFTHGAFDCPQTCPVHSGDMWCCCSLKTCPASEMIGCCLSR